jgi:hypothetical protein
VEIDSQDALALVVVVFTFLALAIFLAWFLSRR